jgi:hypothetical protein
MDDAFPVFVSHSAKDRVYIEIIRGALRGTGARPYVAEEDVTPGAQISEKIRRKIEDCDLFLLLVTQNSLVSSFVNQEVGYALGLEKLLLPIVVGDACPKDLCADIEYIRLDPANPKPAIRAIRALVRSKKDEEDIKDLVKIGAIALGTIAWMKYGSQIKQKAALWWQNLNRPPP